MAPPEQPVAAVLLDMDGTLVDSHEAVERAWRRWCAEHGADTGAFLEIAHGGTADHTIRTLLPQWDEEQVQRGAAEQLALQYADLEDVSPAEGAHELLAALADLGLPWAVVTSADRALAAARLNAAGIRPPLLLTREDVDDGKPHPAPYLRAADLLGVPAQACVVVEDADAGVASARAAGMRCLGVRGVVADETLDGLPAVQAWLRTAAAKHSR